MHYSKDPVCTKAHSFVSIIFGQKGPFVKVINQSSAPENLNCVPITSSMFYNHVAESTKGKVHTEKKGPLSFLGGV